MNTTTKTTVTTATQTVPAVQPSGWSTQDELFFRIVDHVLPAPMVAGASALLASYDED